MPARQQPATIHATATRCTIARLGYAKAEVGIGGGSREGIGCSEEGLPTSRFSGMGLKQTFHSARPQEMH